MFLWIGLGLLYIVLLVTLGVATLRGGHWVMFTLGIFLPILWLIGAVISPSEAARRPGPVGSSQVS